MLRSHTATSVTPFWSVRSTTATRRKISATRPRTCAQPTAGPRNAGWSPRATRSASSYARRRSPSPRPGARSRQDARSQGSAGAGAFSSSSGSARSARRRPWRRATSFETRFSVMGRSLRSTAMRREPERRRSRLRDEVRRHGHVRRTAQRGRDQTLIGGGLRRLSRRSGSVAVPTARPAGRAALAAMHPTSCSMSR